MAHIITMGEIMLRLSTPGFQRIVQSEQFEVTYGGGEANVAVSLSNYNHQVSFVTKLPNNPIGQSAINHLRRYGVDTSWIKRGGDRIGIYFLETGASMRASTVTYDRAHSAIAEAEVSDFDFDEIFRGVDWFHWTGITPALGPKAAALTKRALIAAKKHGVTVSVDLNYRKKLWTPEQAQAIMKDLMGYVDVCIGNEEDAHLVLGFEPKNSNITKGKLDTKGYEAIFKEMAETFGFKYVASSLRESYSATHNGWQALLYDGKAFYQSKRYEIEPIIDRVGGGDSFAGGLIHGLLTREPQEAIEFAVAASALKHTIPGDYNLVDEQEVDKLAKGDASGRVQR